MAPSDADPNIVIGIDFGTTYSGVAWTWSKVEHTEIITSWESREYSNSDNEKVPSAINISKTPGGEVSWGYATDPDELPLRWFKLLLIEEKDLPNDVRESSQLREARAYLRNINKTAIEVIGLYLRHLWNHAIQIITTAVGKAVLNYSQHHVVITLPAIWPEYAKSRMREAAILAGIVQKRLEAETSLTFVSEPEAAALATLSDLTQRPDIKKEDTFVVVDCGGGTVDIISYKIVSTEPMTVRECVTGQGGLCGAVFVDDAFARLLELKMGKASWDKMTSTSRQRILNDDWEHGIKKQFLGQERTWTIQYPFECIDSHERKSLKRWPKIELDADDMCGVFRPVMNKIHDLIENQIEKVTKSEHKAPKYVILVGGFGRCKYLFEDLKLRFTPEILQSRGTGPWTAICRGAVIHALTTQNLHPAFAVHVESRVSRSSYGVMYYTDWDSGKHDSTDKFWHTKEQKYKANNQMRWFLKKGENIVGKTPVRHSYYRLFETPPTSISQTIYMSRTSPASARCDKTVTKFCEIVWEIRIDFINLPLLKNSLGKVYTKVEYDTEMTCSGGSVDFAVYHNGKRVGSKNVSVEFQDHHGFADKV